MSGWVTAQGAPPWRPPSAPRSLARLGDERLADRFYVVVEERIDNAIGLLVSPWPVAREDGAPRFRPGSAEVELAVDLDELERKLRDRDVPGRLVKAAGGGSHVAEELRGRSVEVGDVFSAESKRPPPTPRELERLSGKRGALGWMRSIADVTADAREAAKIVTYEALAPRVGEKVAGQLRGKVSKGGRPR